MEYQSVMRQDYDRKIRFSQQSFFCYSQKEFNRKDPRERDQLIGEVTGRQARAGEKRVRIGRQWYAVLERGSKSRLLYGRAGYLRTDSGGYVVVLKSRLVLYCLLLAAAVAVAVLIWLGMWLRPLTPTLAPLPVDPNVGAIEGDESEKKESEEGGGAVTLTYSLDAKLSLSTGQIRMYFLNPNASNQDIALTLYLVDGETSVKIAQSGRIQPGYGLTDMQFLEGSAALSQGNYRGMYVVSFYDEQTGEKALVESTIQDVTVVVSP